MITACPRSNDGDPPDNLGKLDSGHLTKNHGTSLHTAVSMILGHPESIVELTKRSNEILGGRSENYHAGWP